VNNQIKRYIVKFLTKEINSQELLELTTWLEKSDKNKNAFFKLKEIWGNLNYNSVIKNAQTHLEWEKITLKLHDKKPLSSKVIHINSAGKKKITERFGLLKRIAVILIITVGLNIGWNTFSEQKPTITYTSFNVPFGSKSFIELPDGSTVALNSGSHLRFPSHFEKENRIVYLSGEGFFKVTHKTQKPFTVSTKEMNIHVLGTEFNVMAYDDVNHTETTLNKGSIKITSPDSDVKATGIELKPNQKATKNHRTGKINIINTDSKLDSYWVENKFHFKSIPFSELIKRLERWYNVEIIVKSEYLKKTVYSGKFNNEESIWEILDAIQLTTPITYTHKLRKIYIHHKTQ